MSLRTQKSVMNGLGIDLPLPFYKASVARYLSAAQKKDGAGACGTRFRHCPAAWVQLPCRLGAKVGRFPSLKYGSKTPQAATTAPNAATQVKKAWLPACRLSDLPPGRHSFLPVGRHSCPPAHLLASLPALVPACRHAGIQAWNGEMPKSKNQPSKKLM